MGKFDWQTDEEEWPEPPALESRPLPLWQRLGMVFLVILLVSSSAIGLLRQMNLRSQETVDQATADVQDAHELWRHAVLEQDTQLLAGLLYDTRYPLWAEAQVQHVGSGVSLVDRTAYGLFLPIGEPGADFAAAPNITLATTLSHAELTFTQTYQVIAPAHLTQTITLEHTLTYHYREGRWLAGPLADTAWGASLNHRLPHLTVTYPERDRPVVQRLLSDWSRLIQQLCADALPFRCDRDYGLQVELSSAPNAMYPALAGIELTTIPGQRLYAWPTPTYLGLPVDEAGYEAVCRAYSQPLARQILLDIQANSDLPEVMVYAWVESRLFELGLLASPEVLQVFPGNTRPMPGDRLYPVCVPYAGRIALGGVGSSEQWVVGSGKWAVTWE